MRAEGGSGEGPPRRIRALAALALAVGAGIGLLHFVARPVTLRLDRALYDQMQLRQALRQPAATVPYVLVEIDDPSIEALGRFPWTRNRFSDLLDKTTDGRAKVVGIDVIFSEAADSAGDQAFADALRRAGNVVLAAGATFDRPGRVAPVRGPLARLESAERILEPLPLLARAAAGVGSISVQEDSDGYLRRYPLVIRHGEAPYPSMAQVLAAAVAGEGGDSASLERDGTLLINYGSLSPAAIARVSFSDVLSYSTADALRVFADRVVLVAATYSGGVDVGPTPLATRTPSTYAHIFALQTILTGRYVRPLPAWASAVFAVLLITLVLTQLSGASPLRLLGVTVVLLGGLFAGAALLLAFAGILVQPTLPALSALAFVGGYAVDQWRRDLSARRRAEAFLERFVGAKLRQRRLGGAERDRAQQQELSVISLALSEFATDTESLGAEIMVALARRFHEEAAAAIEAEGGTLDRVTGDGLVAFWGYPVPQRDRAERALRAALDVKSRLRRLYAELKKDDLPGLRVRIGIATGPSILADVGTAALADFTLVGRVAMLANRLRDAAPEGGIHICFVTLTEGRAALPGQPFAQPPLEADGFAEPVASFLVERPFRVWTERQRPSTPPPGVPRP